jgi:hypothetical protein
MQLITVLVYTLAASHLSHASVRRDSGQNEVCLYLTGGPNWGGVGQNLCGQTGICSEYHQFTVQAESITDKHAAARSIDSGTAVIERRLCRAVTQPDMLSVRRRKLHRRCVCPNRVPWSSHSRQRSRL